MNNYVTIKIVGRNPILFLKRLIKLNINYTNLKVKNYNTIYIKILYSDYYKIKDIKTIYEVKIIKYSGLLSVNVFLKKYYIFAISILVSGCVLLLLNNLIFKVEVIHNDKKIRDLISENLIDNDIVKYHFVPSYKKIQKIKEQILKNNKDKIEWLEIKAIGNKIEVKVTERKINVKKENVNNRNIIAKKSGMILKIEATNGVIMKKKYDYVTKGDIIISGDIIKDETIKGQVVAEGKVFAEVWYKSNICYPLYYEEIIYMDEVKNNVILSLLEHKFKLKKDYENMAEERKINLIKKRIFPFELYLQKQRKVKIVKQKLTKEKALEKAVDVASDKIGSTLKNEEYIINKNILNYTSYDDKIEVNIFFKVYEDITDYIDTIPVPENNNTNLGE